MAGRLEKLLSGAGIASASAGREGRVELRLAGGRGRLVLSASAGSQSISIEPDSPSCGTEPWDSLLSGCVLTGVSQHRCDRLLLFGLKKEKAYRSSSMTLRFEAAGRNANAVLTRDGDDRILACTRIVTRAMSSYRTIAPGGIYAPPPPSGIPPAEWGSREAAGVLSAASSPRPIYTLLEGVGPQTAQAMLAEAALAGSDPARIAEALAEALSRRCFRPWTGPWGPMPVPLGPGEPLEDPLSAFEPSRGAGEDARLSSFLARSASSARDARERLGRLRAMLADLPDSGTLRLWGQMLLASAGSIPRGASEVRLEDWEGAARTIPLRPARSAAENAARYFRKAGNTEAEAASLAGRIAALEERAEAIERAASEAAGTGVVPETGPSRRQAPAPAGPQPVEISEGWLCFVGRNSRNNEEVTFRVGRRGDWWLHARGIPGPHVVLRGEPGRGNPPASVLRRAAELAAEGAACTSSVVPVDWTMVQHVRRMKGGRPGEVTYTREKTIFVSPGGAGGRRIRGRGRAFDTEG